MRATQRFGITCAVMPQLAHSPLLHAMGSPVASAPLGALALLGPGRKILVDGVLALVRCGHRFPTTTPEQRPDPALAKKASPCLATLRALHAIVLVIVVGSGLARLGLDKGCRIEGEARRAANTC